MESPDKSKFLIDLHLKTFQFSNSMCEKNNYGRFNILPVLSKLLEMLFSKQVAKILERILSKCQCGFILRKAVARNLLTNDAWSLKKKLLIIKTKRSENCWQIYLKHLISWVMIYWLLTFMQMISTCSSVPNFRGIKFHFWTNLPSHFTLLFSTLVTVLPEKTLLLMI